MKKATAIGPVSNGGANDIALTEPYAVKVAIEGTAALLFHAGRFQVAEFK